MSYLAAALTLVVAALLPSQDARAQGAEPFVRVSLDPPRVVVGQSTRLRIDVLAPNYMTGQPELPGFQVRNAVTRQLQTVNINEQKDGTSFGGVRFTYAIYPQEAGSFAIADQKVRVKYAANPPATREVEVALPLVSFESFIPDAAAELQPFISASKLTVEQTIKRSSEQLKTGDSVTRTITIKADGTLAMLLPPQQFAEVGGFRLYPTQPVLEDRIDGRTDVLTATRVDSATYMLERAGEYALPAIDIGWWNVGSGKVEMIRLEAVPLKVAANPAAGNTAPTERRGPSWAWGGIVDLIADHWLAALLTMLLVAAFGWFAPGMIRRAADHRRRRQQAYLQSEAFAFSRFSRAIRHRDAKAAYFTLLDWLPHLGRLAPDRSLDAFKEAAGDAALNREIEAVESELFSVQRGPGGWSPHQLLRRMTVARRHLHPRPKRRDRGRLLPYLNPDGISNAPSYKSRKPAR